MAVRISFGLLIATSLVLTVYFGAAAWRLCNDQQDETQDGLCPSKRSALKDRGSGTRQFPRDRFAPGSALHRQSSKRGTQIEFHRAVPLDAETSIIELESRESPVQKRFTAAVIELTEVTNVIETESFKARQIWIDRYRDLERQVTDPLAALLVHDIVLELETREGEPSPVACDPDAPTRTA